MRIIDCGLMEYRKSLALQERLAAAIWTGKEEETLLLLQHPPVYTIGRGGNSANILDPAVTVERVNRGGDVTWHGPGQVVGYPLVDLGRRGRDLHRWLRFLEEVLVRTLAAFGIAPLPLRLAALLLRDSPDRQATVDSFAGSNRVVG